MDAASVIPAVNQVELHPYFTNATVQAAGKTLGILTRRGPRSAASTATVPPAPATRTC
jgi:hypothetical protein